MVVPIQTWSWVHQIAWKCRIQVTAMWMIRETVLRLTVSDWSAVGNGERKEMTAKNKWKNNSIKIEWNKSSLCVCYECHSTLLWQLCQRPKNVIRDSAYRHQSCSGFPSGRCVAAVSNVHCTLIPDPSPKHASCNYTSHRIVIEFKYYIRSERLFRSFNNMIRIIIINIQQTGSCYVIFNLKQSTWIGYDPNCVTTIPMLFNHYRYTLARMYTTSHWCILTIAVNYN